MEIVAKGSNIKIEYEGKFESGEIFDSSKHGDHSHPLEFEVGSGQIITGLDESVIGMKVGEEKEIIILPKDAYGDIDERAIQEVPKNALPKDHEPKEGMKLLLSLPNGQQMQAKITKVAKDKVTIDLNHPLAGKTLIFKIKLIEIHE